MQGGEGLRRQLASRYQVEHGDQYEQDAALHLSYPEASRGCARGSPAANDWIFSVCFHDVDSADYCFNRYNCRGPERGLIITFCPPMTTGPEGWVLQTEGDRLVADCKVNPTALVGHVKMTFAP